MKKNIVVVIEDMQIGGAQRVVYELASGFKAKGYHVKIVCIRDEGPLSSIFKTNNIPVSYHRKRHRIDFKFFFSFLKEIKKNKEDIIISHLFTPNLWTAIVSFLVKIKFFPVYHNVDKWKRWYHFLLDKFIMKRAVVGICVSKSIKEFYFQKCGFDLKIIYNGISKNITEIDKTEVMKLKHTFNPEGKKVILSVGRFVPQKRPLLLLKIIEQLNKMREDFIFFMIGTGPLYKIAKEFIKEKGINNTYLLGERNDVYNFFSIANVFAMASEWEGFPIVGLEAMMFGLPVIAFDVEGWRDMIENGKNGYCVKSIEEYREKLNKLLDGELYKRKGQIQRYAIERYEREKMVKEYLDTIFKEE